MREVLADLLREWYLRLFPDEGGGRDPRVPRGKGQPAAARRRSRRKISSSSTASATQSPAPYSAITSTCGSSCGTEPTPTHLLAGSPPRLLPPNTYRMNPYCDWSPDINELERKVKSHKAIVGILVISRTTPPATSIEETLIRIVDIARRYDLFLIFDETYHNIVFNGGRRRFRCPDIIDKVGNLDEGESPRGSPGGSRCGWMEIYNADKDETFARYIDAILTQKMSEVCSTTLPQMAIRGS